MPPSLTHHLTRGQRWGGQAALLKVVPNLPNLAWSKLPGDLPKYSQGRNLPALKWVQSNPSQRHLQMSAVVMRWDWVVLARRLSGDTWCSSCRQCSDCFATTTKQLHCIKLWHTVLCPSSSGPVYFRGPIRFQRLRDVTCYRCHSCEVIHEHDVRQTTQDKREPNTCTNEVSRSIIWNRLENACRSDNHLAVAWNSKRMVFVWFSDIY